MMRKTPRTVNVGSSAEAALPSITMNDRAKGVR